MKCPLQTRATAGLTEAMLRITSAALVASAPEVMTGTGAAALAVTSNGAVSVGMDILQSAEQATARPGFHPLRLKVKYYDQIYRLKQPPSDYIPGEASRVMFRARPHGDALTPPGRAGETIVR
jgi:hypothetical protein